MGTLINVPEICNLSLAPVLRKTTDYPTATGGRGADTALMTSWLEDLLLRVDPRQYLKLRLLEH